jgi:hypothetical protein
MRLINRIFCVSGTLFVCFVCDCCEIFLHVEMCVYEQREKLLAETNADQKF